ncbi:MAG: signal peptidase II [Actinomycetota bacterium]
MQEGGRAEVARQHPPAEIPSRKALLGAAAAVAAADQLTKAAAVAALSGGRSIPIIGSVFQLKLITNSGTAFGLFQRIPLVIFGLNVVILSFVAVWAYRHRAGAAFGMVIGGGLGNLADRMFRPPGSGLGKVVDFFYLSFWPTFNVADAAIVLGVGYLVFQELRRGST